ncbi:ABC transporter permease [Nocardia sp. NBC_01327]|uniref:ABC transporter permease n=1 Tax=Nocardia sp. NBC_01327 TaxID=2903593 RepID=UPI002E147BAC|nr:ABC transporter permease [Nocardia sp. NBC_01327]
MAATYVPPLLRPVRALVRAANAPVNAVRLAGHQAFFFVRCLADIPLAFKHYRKDVWRLLSDVTWGNGSLVVGGGVMGVIIAMNIFVGITIGLEAFSQLDLLGMGPVTGAITAFAVTREIGPMIAVVAFVVQGGCRITAQLGTMRISEEIDALDSLAIRPMPYLVSTRILAAWIAIVPMYLVGLCAAYLSARFTVTLMGGTSSGTYFHYFQQFFVSTDLLFSILKAVVFVTLTTFIQSYYGFFAEGGPEGVGIAAGAAIKVCFVVVVLADLLLTLGIWGIDPGIRFSG